MSYVRIRLEQLKWTGPQLFVRYSVNGAQFTNSIWYEGVDLGELATRWGTAFMRRVSFHVAAFELNKLASLKADVVDWGSFSDLVTERFEALWRRVFQSVWAQWRYENGLPDYAGPAFEAGSIPVRREPGPALRRGLGHDRFLALFAGGKDSLVASKILEAVELDYESLTYYASYYGTTASQHELVSRLVPHIAPTRHRRQWIFDDFLDSPVLELFNPHGTRTLAAAETPSSVFAVLPYVLADDITHVALAHERSADKGQLTWPLTGEEVNHQWGKSFEAESLINAYLRTELIEDFSYFSLLKPIHDLSIFHALRGHEDAVPFTHSCNVQKPWCLRCPKCLYVWLGYAAFLDPGVVRETFGADDLLTREENRATYRALVGLEQGLPFDCVGEAGEAALLMRLAEARGYGGCALDSCRPALDGLDTIATLDRYLAVAADGTSLPASHRDALLRWMRANAADAREFVRSRLD